MLFFQRDLKALVVIELKKGKFKPSYLGQLNFYLAALDEKERKNGENPAIGILLCHEANKSVVELHDETGFYKRESLAVQKANYAVKMYERVGVQTVDEN